MSLTDSLLIYHRFRSGIAEDLSGNSRSLEEVGTSTTYGPIGTKALQGTGALFTKSAGHYLRRPGDDSVFDFGSGSFTISLWVKLTATTSEQNLTEKFDTMTGPGWTLYKKSSDHVEFYHSGGVTLTSSSTLSAGTWYHIFLRRNGSAWTLHINNSSEASTTSAAAITDTTQQLRLGHRNENDGRNFPLDGIMDEYAIWSRALSDDEKSEVYNSGVGKFLLGTKVGRSSNFEAGGTSGVKSWIGSDLYGGGGYAGSY